MINQKILLAIDEEQHKTMGSKYIICAAFSVALIKILALLGGVDHEQNKKSKPTIQPNSSTY